MLPGDRGRNEPTRKERASLRSWGFIPHFLHEQDNRDLGVQLQALPRLWRQSGGANSPSDSQEQQFSSVTFAKLSMTFCPALLCFSLWLEFSCGAG